MDLFDALSALKLRATEQLPLLDSKRKRENALLLPFLAALGYSPFDVRDVEPEFPIRLEEGGERSVDYAAKKGGSPALLFHLKEMGTNLEASGPAGLLQALKGSGARVGALTDGLQYRFYADLQPFYAVLKGGTTAEEEPFLTFNLFDCSEGEAEKLIPLTKPEFRADEILSLAHRQKYTRLFRTYLQRQRESPDQAFVQFLMEQVHGGTPPKGDVGMYATPARDALRQLMGGEGGAEGQAPTQEETTEEKTEEGVRLGEKTRDGSEKTRDGSQETHDESQKTRDGEEVGSGTDEETSIDQNFREFFRKRLRETNEENPRT